jgi:hypothetical protein
MEYERWKNPVPILKLDENSLVILRPEQKVEEVNLLTGTLRAMRTKLITPTAQVTPQTDKTIYKAKIREDKATIVHVEKGSAEVYGLDTGKKVIISEGYANITLPKGDPSLPVKAPDLAEFDLPQFGSKGEIILQNAPQVELPKNIESGIKTELPSIDQGVEKEVHQLKNNESLSSKFKNVKNWTAYRLQIAKDQKFSQIVWDEKKGMGIRKSIDESQKNKLADGKYFRRVSFFDDSDRESEFFIISPIEIKTRPPKLIIIFPEEGYKTHEGLVNIEGQAEADSFVTINNYPVPVKADGKFSWSVVLVSEGANKIKIVARDRFRNRTQLERTIYLSSK